MEPRKEMSGHWTDERLIQHVYAVGGSDEEHLLLCAACQERLAVLRSARQAVESEYAPQNDVSAEFLAAQRRSIYAKLEGTTPWWQGFTAGRWASAAALLVILGGGFTVVESKYGHRDGPVRQQAQKATVSDAELAAEVGRIAESSEPDSAAPLKGLFEE